ncbi:MAG: hypothetical protein AB7L90_02605 [Hyphomicrobiaceae bacterium]
MTRSKLTRTLRWSYLALGFVLSISLLAKLAPYIPGIAGSPAQAVAADIYDYLKDMALVFITVVATVLAGIYQRRQSFLSALKDEWREIVDAKSKLYAYTRLHHPTEFDYVEAFTAISATLDNMRTVYANVGETESLIGIYPFAPLHDMRRALQTLDPSKETTFNDEQRKLARDGILQSFYALRETFLEELELEPPDRPLLMWGSRRHKRTGATDWAREAQFAERSRTDAVSPPDMRIDGFLRQLYEKEHTTEKPWRNLADGPLRGSKPAREGGEADPPLT